MSNELDLLPMLALIAGGLALFLFGLELMTASLKAVAGPGLQTALGKLTAGRFRGLLAGAFVTALLNSSTITTVLMVGFVSAGLMTLNQTVPLIMGANIGSTITAQIIAFNLSAATPVILAVGFLLRSLGRREAFRHLGTMILGFGLLFLGIQFMGDGTRPLRSFQPFIEVIQDMRNPLVGILLGAFFTAIVQSSAATIAIAIAIASQGLMPLEAGIALIFGANVGTCVTALLAAIGKSAGALQVGVVHLLFNVFGVIAWVFFIPQLAELVRHISPSATDLEGAARLAAETPRQLANAHTLFSVATTFVLIWFTGPVAKIAQMIVPSRRRKVADDFEPIYLDESGLTAPSLGVQRVYLELGRLGQFIVEMVQRARSVFVEGGKQDLDALVNRNSRIDRLESSILIYLGRLSQLEHTKIQAREMIGLAQIASTLESLSDVITTNLASRGRQRLAAGIDLARLRDERTSAFTEAVFQTLQQSIAAIDSAHRDNAEKVLAAKAQIQELAELARASVFAKLELSEKKDVASFSLAMDMIEQSKQIGHLARQIARVAQELPNQRVTGPLPIDTSAPT
ncbi:MAG: Na/Pi cotransporter family protein [Verrucomicrobia bacterium]|nr:Na/Pi cotransporter family protein [Verrucomicrobiota bacterium]